MEATSFESLVNAHHPEIYRYLLRATRRPSDADDLSQETFLRAYRSYRALPQGANTRAWLFKIATNLSRNHYRSQKRRWAAHVRAHEVATDVGVDTPERETVSREIGTVIEAVVGRLPLKQRLAFLQRKIHELDYETIGESLSCSAESARAHVFQALRKVRHALNGYELLEEERRR